MGNQDNAEMLLFLVTMIMILGIVRVLQNFFITYKLSKMNENITQLNEALDTATGKLTKVAADVASLHSKIDAITADQPTAEEWAGIKQKATELNSGLQKLDDTTEDTVADPAPKQGTSNEG